MIESPGTRSNVILIIRDDLGAVDLNCHGASGLHTPDLDKTASQFTRSRRRADAVHCAR
jgi:arylsulfatase A-like enzyme